MRYYWCVNCGYHGDFGFERLRNQTCESCNYDGVTGYEEDELEETGFMEKHKRQKEDPYYDGRLKHKKTKTVGKNG